MPRNDFINTDGTINYDNIASTSQNSINIKYPPSPLVGAKGDGVTDDATAIQNIINYAISLSPNKSIIFVPNGTYNIVENLVNTDKVTFICDNASFTGNNVPQINYNHYYAYGDDEVEFLIENQGQSFPATIDHNENTTITIPKDTFRIFRTSESTGVLSNQTGGFIVRNTVNPGCTHHEYGIFSVFNNQCATVGTENVGMYSQINAIGGSLSTLWGSVFEVRDTYPSGVSNTPATNEKTLCGIEIDIATHFTYNTLLPKLGIAMYAYGGGQSGEAIRIAAGGNTSATPGNYNSGDWHYGINFTQNSINANGYGIFFGSNHDTGIAFASASHSTNYGINMSGTGSTAINIGSGYTNPIAVQADKRVKLNSETNTQAVYFNSTNSAVTFDGSAIGVDNHVTYTSASAGGTQAVPATVSGYLGVYVNGYLKKVPYFN